MTTLRIPSRFNGPPGSGNGGWVGGLLAEQRDDAVVQVILRSPPPLESPLRVVGGYLFDGDTLVAEAAAGEFTAAAPAPVERSVAVTATVERQGDSPFRKCFVCGDEREDGLGIQAGAVADGVVAAPWSPDDTLPIGTPLLWAAMDCPGGFTVPEIATRPAVLGSMTATVHALPAVGEQCVVVGELRGEQGRKGLTATAIYGEDGRLLGRSEQVWIRLS
ncbi:hypothetical protein [Nocardia huaxiensis]|uniref:Thioesterase superfamily protein n=1 Tax=Nocardia huaxiensis TaxID=2755382 RepID=A0A7D6VGB5_9NOCA|nr:hypothetical protein [Nocardia huaxiensis]QLY32015.1 hypothetical protein H0264_06885 [Nocardia huaxiensis]UFS95589.1 hypothetical protein LPY97_33775 [Nocardia huaxiensis]